MIQSDPDRLDRILSEIHKHGGATTLHKDYVWLQHVQAELPEWAKPVFQKYVNEPHVHQEILRNATR
jgi:hypothetical protein